MPKRKKPNNSKKELNNKEIKVIYFGDLNPKLIKLKPPNLKIFGKENKNLLKLPKMLFKKKIFLHSKVILGQEKVKLQA